MASVHQTSAARVGRRTTRSGRLGPRDLLDAVVPDAHLNAAVAGIRGLGGAGLRVLALGPSWAAAGLWSKHAALRAVSPSVADDAEGYADRLEHLAATVGPVAVYPSREETIDAMLRQPGGMAGVILPFPGAPVLDRVRNKERLAATAAAAGIDTPGALFSGAVGELRRARFPGPAVMKPAQPVSILKTARLVKTQEEMEAWLAPLADEEQILVQERVRGPIVSIELVLDQDGNLVARFQHVTSRTWPSAAGSISLATSVEPDEELVRRTAAMLADIGYWGLAQVDFVDTPLGPVLLDVNPRFYRCLPLAIACGTNLPALWHAVTSGRPVGSPGRYRVGVTYRWLEADFAAAVRGTPRRLLHRTPAPHAGASWASGDPVPGFLLSAAALTDRILRRVRMRSGTR